MSAKRKWIPEEDFGTRLRLVRFKKDLSSAELADISGVTSNAVLAWERGSTPKNQVEIATRISDATDVDLGWLLLGEVGLAGLEPATERSEADDIFSLLSAS